MRSTLCLLALCTAAYYLGCGGGGGPAQPAQDTVKVTSTDQLKERLKFVAESGTAGSALAGMIEMIEKIEDPAKRETLTKQYHQISASGNPKEVKKLANEMLSEL